MSTEHCSAGNVESDIYATAPHKLSDRIHGNEPRPQMRQTFVEMLNMHCLKHNKVRGVLDLKKAEGKCLQFVSMMTQAVPVVNPSRQNDADAVCCSLVAGW